MHIYVTKQLKNRLYYDTLLQFKQIYYATTLYKKKRCPLFFAQT